MHFLSLIASSLLASSALARSPRHVGIDVPWELEKRAHSARPRVERRASESKPNYGGPAKDGYIIKQTAETKKFAVDGTALPFVDFNVGESYAGLLPISNEKDVSELYFWFYPSNNENSTDEILIWLNGGPGCSSLEGILQENGPALWQYGTYRPVENPYTWINLTNVVWIEQPAGTGFSQQKSTPPATSEEEVAAQFLGFWKNFVDTFGLHNRKVYITGESYAGYYVPYIADAFHNQSNTEYYDMRGALFYDPVISYSGLQQSIPAAQMVNYWDVTFNLNDTYKQYLNDKADSCGFTDFIDTAMTFPPTGPLPDPPKHHVDHCDIWKSVIPAAMAVNPCWDIYDLTTTCPNLWDVLGFPGSFFYEPAPWNYFNRTDVKKVINAPMQDWGECTGGILSTDTSEPSSFTVLPRVIEKNDRTIIGHGMADFILLVNGTIMAVQNMTWGGSQGFSKGPSDWNDFYVPYHTELNQGSTAGAGYLGKWWEERKFTLCTVDLSGHMVPQYQPSSAYRQLEYLLGRISSLSEVSDFTTQSGSYGNNA